MIDETNGIDIEEVIDYLLGTCKSLDEGISEIYEDKDFTDLTLNQCTILDDNIMCCECCGWWVNSHEIDENNFCEDCQEAEKENNDED